jgi:hypothetical protein
MEGKKNQYELRRRNISFDAYMHTYMSFDDVPEEADEKEYMVPFTSINVEGEKPIDHRRVCKKKTKSSNEFISFKSTYMLGMHEYIGVRVVSVLLPVAFLCVCCAWKWCVGSCFILHQCARACVIYGCMCMCVCVCVCVCVYLCVNVCTYACASCVYT